MEVKNPTDNCTYSLSDLEGSWDSMLTLAKRGDVAWIQFDPAGTSRRRIQVIADQICCCESRHDRCQKEPGKVVFLFRNGSKRNQEIALHAFSLPKGKNIRFVGGDDSVREIVLSRAEVRGDFYGGSGHGYEPFEVQLDINTIPSGTFTLVCCILRDEKSAVSALPADFDLTKCKEASTFSVTGRLRA